MSYDKEKTKLRFLIPVQNLPFVRRQKFSFYDDILEEFIGSNLKYAEIKELGGRKPVTVALVLKGKIKKRNIENIRVLTRGKKVYIARVEE